MTFTKSYFKYRFFCPQIASILWPLFCLIFDMDRGVAFQYIKDDNENDPFGDDQFVNIEGLKRVYKPKE